MGSRFGHWVGVERVDVWDLLQCAGSILSLLIVGAIVCHLQITALKIGNYRFYCFLYPAATSLTTQPGLGFKFLCLKTTISVTKAYEATQRKRRQAIAGTRGRTPLPEPAATIDGLSPAGIMQR